MTKTLEQVIKEIENGDHLPSHFKTVFKTESFSSEHERHYIYSIIQNQVEDAKWSERIKSELDKMDPDYSENYMKEKVEKERSRMMFDLELAKELQKK